MKIPPRFPVFFAGALVGGCIAFYLLPRPEPEVVYVDRPVEVVPSTKQERRHKLRDAGKEYVR